MESRSDVQGIRSDVAEILRLFRARPPQPQLVQPVAPDGCLDGCNGLDTNGRLASPIPSAPACGRSGSTGGGSGVPRGTVTGRMGYRPAQCGRCGLSASDLVLVESQLPPATTVAVLQEEMAYQAQVRGATASGRAEGGGRGGGCDPQEEEDKGGKELGGRVVHIQIKVLVKCVFDER